MIVRTAKKQQRYSTVDNTGFEDPRLSYKAKGLLGYFLTKPDNWKIRMEDLLNHGTDGLDSIKTGLKELRQIGYAEIVIGRDHLGQLTGKEWVIHETPIVGKSTFRQPTDSGKNPRSGKPDYRENPIIGKSLDIVSTDYVVNTDDVVNTDTTSGAKNPDGRNQKKEKAPPIPAAPPVLFTESEWIRNPGRFISALSELFPQADGQYYFNRCKTWSRNKQAKSSDWLQQASDLIESDRLRGELHTIQPISDASNTTPSGTGRQGRLTFDRADIAERARRTAERIGR